MSVDIEIRAARPEDADGVLALNRRVAADAPYFLAYEMDPASGAEMLQAKLQGPGGDGDGVLVATSAQRVVGAALIRRHRHPAFAGVAQLALAVDPDWRGKGVGRGLTGQTIETLRDAGARRLQLAVIEGNAAALALFRAGGFQEEGRLVQAAEIDGRRRDVIVMGMALA